MSSDRRAFETGSIADDEALPRVLIAALEETSSPVCITTADLDEPGPTIVYVNPAYCAMTRRSREDVIGRSPRIMQGPLTDRAVLDRLRDDLTAGRRFSGATINYRSDGEPFHIAWGIDPVLDDQGVATHYVATQRDVTTEVIARRLRAAEEHLDTALVDALASPTDTESALSVVLAGVATAAARIAAFGTVEATLRDVTLGTLRARVDAGGEPPQDPGSTAGIQFPIVRVDGVAIGSISISNLRAAERDVIDRPSLNRLAERAASVIAALGEYQRQRRTALRLQEAILPRVEAAPPGFEIATRYIPGADGVHVGGDWFDVFEIDGDLVAVVGDVSGHGIDAATTMARLQTLAAAETRAERPIDEVLEVLDRACRDDATMATIAIARIALDDGTVRVWSCGHLPPMRFGSGDAELVGVRPAPPLGHLRGDRPTPTTVTLQPGDTLTLFTDGLVEQRGEPITEGLERLRTQLRGADGPLTDLLDDLTDPRRADDDTAVVALRRLPPSDEEQGGTDR